MNNSEKIFRENELFSRKDILISFELFIEHIKENGYPKCSSVVLKNRIKLCDKFFKVIQKCVLPTLSADQLYYEYQYLIDRIDLNLCRADEIEVDENDSLRMSSTIERTLITVECDYLSMDQFAALHNVDDQLVHQWISRGKIRHAKKHGDSWIIPNTEDKPRREFELVAYVVKADEHIESNDFPILAMCDSVFISQDEKNQKIYHCSFSNNESGTHIRSELTKSEVERLEYAIIKSGKANIEATVQYVPGFDREIIPTES